MTQAMMTPPISLVYAIPKMSKTLIDFGTSDNGLDTPYLNHVKGNLVAIWHATVLLGL